MVSLSRIRLQLLKEVIDEPRRTMTSTEQTAFKRYMTRRVFLKDSVKT